MLNDYIAINRLLRTLINEIIVIFTEQNETSFPNLREDQQIVIEKFWELRNLLPKELNQETLEERFKFINNLNEIELESNLGLGTLYLVSDVIEQLEKHYSKQSEPEYSNEIFDLLHPIIKESSYHHFLNGHYRDAVLNAFIAVFDFLRQRTNLDLDGAKLAQAAYAPDAALLIVSTLQTESGKSEQVGFMNLLIGAYSSIRNPKAHSLEESPNRSVAAQNLILASLLARRIDESKEPSEDKLESHS